MRTQTMDFEKRAHSSSNCQSTELKGTTQRVKRVSDGGMPPEFTPVVQNDVFATVNES